MTDQNNLPAFKKLIKENNLDGFIVTNPINIFYLTGFKGVLPQERESILVFNPSATLITAMIYQNEARRIKTKNLKVKIVNERNQILDFAKTLLSQKHPRGVESFHLGGEIRSKDRKIGFEEEDLKFSEHKLLTSNQKPESRNEFIPFKNLVEDLRVIKTDGEIKRIEKAQTISQKAFNILVKTIKIGQTEAEIAEVLAKIIKSQGADSLAFESIIAAGKNAGLPHYATGRKKIKKGQVLLFDFGAKYQDYCADLSRTIFIGRVPSHQKNIYMHVATAQKAAIAKITHGLKASDAYHTANNLFRKQSSSFFEVIFT